MLSEPKRKTVWSLNPRGKYWSEDKSKIGQKLLESMGWREGLGLGKNNDGIKQNVKLGINLDNKGLGYKSSADDVWFDKNSDFEQLLANLAVHHNNGSNKKEVKVSNLEEVSKKLRNRLHYNKFIKSKDLSQCSEKDLISIFPKKRQNSEELKVCEENSDKSEQNINNCRNTFESNTNINDYFRSKMDKLKLKYQFNKNDSTKVNDNYIEEGVIIEDEDNGLVKDSTSTKSKKRKIEEFNETSNNSLLDSSNELNVKHKKYKKSKKSKRNKEKVEQKNDSLNEDLESNQQIVTKTEKINEIKDLTNDCDSEKEIQMISKKIHKKLKTNFEEYKSIVPKGYNIHSISVNESLKKYSKICAAIEMDEVLSTTNLITLKGYGCHL